ncbi:hypothetical protein FOVG_18359 [Fusarium oxysporum f. sp. pisi HDV247]|uniref:Uncharacterized protein n=1 Tax=Fusarium oxysporum f. sp. pisi HDV247 TaxID=1080344 RepID=W9NBS0_FUSOX|nr:hypothetical protein FOVG_18359 [Fusarium oxysporum f. sp. pisi HDV247]
MALTVDMLRRWRFLNFSNLGFMHSWLMHGPRRAQFGPFLCQNFTWAPTVPKSPIRPTERPHMCCRLGPKPDGVSPIQEPGPFVHTHSPMKAEIGSFGCLPTYTTDDTGLIITMAIKSLSNGRGLARN